MNRLSNADFTSMIIEFLSLIRYSSDGADFLLSLNLDGNLWSRIDCIIAQFDLSEFKTQSNTDSRKFIDSMI